MERVDNGPQRGGLSRTGRPPYIDQAATSRLAHHPALLCVKRFFMRQKDNIRHWDHGDMLRTVGQHALGVSCIERGLATLNFQQLVPQSLDKERIVHDQPSKGYLFALVLDEGDG